MKTPVWQGTVWYPFTNYSSIQNSIFQIHQIFNIFSYFPEFNLFFEKKYLPQNVQKSPKHLHKTAKQAAFHLGERKFEELTLRAEPSLMKRSKVNPPPPRVKPGQTGLLFTVCEQAHLGVTRASDEEQSDPAGGSLVKRCQERHFLVSRSRLRAR